LAIRELARHGWDALDGPGVRSQYFKDRRGQVVHVRIHASDDGRWDICGDDLWGTDCHAAVRAWLGRQTHRSLVLLVHSGGVELRDPPRAYIAEPAEVARVLKAAAGGRGRTGLVERSGDGAVLPHWRLSPHRLAQVSLSMSH
jgi:hypothetical protein